MNVIWLKNKNACMESIVIPYTFICRLKCEQVLFVIRFYNNPAPLNGSAQFHYCTDSNPGTGADDLLF